MIGAVIHLLAAGWGPWAASGLDWSLVPFPFWAACFFVLGCVVGSFLNVCIHRMPLGMSVVSPPSHCPRCKYAIPWYLNIPLVTWLWLGGKCRNCGARISVRYFAVELLTGTAFLGCWLEFGNTEHPFYAMAMAMAWAVFLSGLIVATFIDIAHFIIPDEITLGGLATGLAVSFLLPGLHSAPSHVLGLLRGALGATVGAAVTYGILRFGKLLFGRQKVKLPAGAKIVFSETSLYLPDREIPYEELFYRKSDVIALKAERLELVDRGYRDVSVRLSPVVLEIGGEKLNPDDVPCMEAVSSEIVLPREAMGAGDVKFMAAIGSFLGWTGAFFALMASSLIGATIGLLLIMLRRREWSSRMPYGPYIALAAAIWVFLGKRIFHALLP